MEYGDSSTALVLALRKAPEQTGRDFRLQVEQLKVIVELLTGSIPDRAIFENQEYKTDLAPYLEMVKHVREGDLDQF